MTYPDDAGQWDHEDPPEPDYETWERDQLARDAGLLDDHVWCSACGAMTPDCYSTCNNCGCDWHDDDDPDADEEEGDD